MTDNGLKWVCRMDAALRAWKESKFEARETLLPLELASFRVLLVPALMWFTTDNKNACGFMSVLMALQRLDWLEQKH